MALIFKKKGKKIKTTQHPALEDRERMLSLLDEAAHYGFEFSWCRKDTQDQDQYRPLFAVPVGYSGLLKDNILFTHGEYDDCLIITPLNKVIKWSDPCVTGRAPVPLTSDGYARDVTWALLWSARRYGDEEKWIRHGKWEEPINKILYEADAFIKKEKEKEETEKLNKEATLLKLLNQQFE